MTAGGTNLAALVAITAITAVALTWLGIREGLLRMRPEVRRCPNCGRRLHSWTCWTCTESRDR
jgi:recombinational DNA repair protein RecR